MRFAGRELRLGALAAILLLAMMLTGFWWARHLGYKSMAAGVAEDLRYQLLRQQLEPALLRLEQRFSQDPGLWYGLLHDKRSGWPHAVKDPYGLRRIEAEGLKGWFLSHYRVPLRYGGAQSEVFAVLELVVWPWSGWYGLLLIWLPTVLLAYLVQHSWQNYRLAVQHQHRELQDSQLVVRTIKMLAHDLHQPFQKLRWLLSQTTAKPQQQQQPCRAWSQLDAQVSTIEIMLANMLQAPVSDQALKAQKICLSNLVQRSLELQYMDPNAQDIRLSFYSDPRLTSTEIWGELVRLERAVGNILQNAKQHVEPQGSITLWLGSSQPGWLSLYVHNTGSFITATEQENIFRPYHTTSVRGHGLGLAVAAAVARAHGGRLSCHSYQQVGTAFCLDLPCTTAKTAAPHVGLKRQQLLATQAWQQLLAESCPRIAWFEEDAWYRQVLAQQFSNGRLELFSKLEELRAALLAGEKFDLLVADYCLDTAELENGLALHQLLSRSELYKGPFLIVSAYPVCSDKSGVLAVGKEIYNWHGLRQAIYATESEPEAFSQKQHDLRNQEISKQCQQWLAKQESVGDPVTLVQNPQGIGVDSVSLQMEVARLFPNSNVELVSLQNMRGVRVVLSESLDGFWRYQACRVIYLDPEWPDAKRYRVMEGILEARAQ